MKINRNKKPEILAPIQDWTSLQAAIDNGADAVFFGIKGFNMRSNAKNFEVKNLSKLVKTAKASKVKTYLTLNIIVYDAELKKVESLLKKVKAAGVDAVICWDLAVIEICKKIKLNFHISTQASIANSMTAEFYRKLGAERVVLARECSLPQIKAIQKNVKVEIEIFIHGAMCVSMSGRCFLSQFSCGKSANRGECTQPCRRKYNIKQVDGDAEFEIGADYVMSPKDMRTIDIIEQILEADVDCLKIEGRNRSPEYVAHVVSAYRQIVDFIYDTKVHNNKFYGELDELKLKLNTELDTVYHRGQSTGFFMGKPMNEWTKSYGNEATVKKIHLGKIVKFYGQINVAEVTILSKESIKIGDKLVYQGATTGSYEEEIASMEIEHKPIKKAVQGDTIAIKVNKLLKVGDEVFVIIKGKSQDY
jgi:putative protease